MVKFEDLIPGSEIVVRDDVIMHCLHPGEVCVVYADAAGDLLVICADGFHTLKPDESGNLTEFDVRRPS
jgi:hypothetical protein